MVKAVAAHPVTVRAKGDDSELAEEVADRYRINVSYLHCPESYCRYLSCSRCTLDLAG